MVVPYVGTWIEIRNATDEQYNLTSRSLRGNVDRNLLLKMKKRLAKVVPYVGTWIEIMESAN